MKISCKQCGTVIQVGDGDGAHAHAQSLLKQHTDQQHGSIESKHAKTLNECRSAFFVLSTGGRITPKQAKQLHDQVSDLLSQPGITEEKKNETVSQSSSVIPVAGNDASKNISGSENVVPVTSGD